jgi:hypothetical protein
MLLPPSSSGTAVLCVNDSLSELAEALKTVTGLIALDGCTGVRKTRLAEKIGAARPDSEVIEVDRFLEPNQDQYVAALRVVQLREAVWRALNRSGIVILDGVCARDVICLIGCNAAFHVYVQRNSSVGVPQHLDILDQEEKDAPSFHDPACPPSLLELELAEYHRRRQPRRNADIIFVWSCD